MAKLTKRIIEGAKPQKKDFILWDDHLKGFGVRVKPSGRITFIIQYRNLQGRSRRFTLGTYGRLTVDQAKKQARMLLSDVDMGGDPVEVKYQGRNAPIIKQVADRYISEHALPKKKPSSVKRDQELLRRFILPELGHRRIEEVTRADVAKLHHNMRATPTQANRTMAVLSKMFSLADRWGLIAEGSNPCRHIERYKEKKRDRFLSKEELSRLGKVLRDAEKDGSEQPAVINAIRLLIFTGARLSEMLELKWPEVDLERAVLSLPDSKTGKKTIHLSKPALEVLANTPRMRFSPYVFPGSKPGKPIGWIHGAWGRIRKQAGIEDVRLHDLRHSFASIAVAEGIGLPIIGALLGHTQASTTQRYAHLADDPLRKAVNQIGLVIAGKMEIGEE